MKKSLCLGFCVAVLLCSSVRTERGDDAPHKEFLESLNAFKETFLQDWDFEIQNSRSILVFPVAVIQEFLLEYALRLPAGALERTKVSEVLPFHSGLPFALNLSHFGLSPLRGLAIETFNITQAPVMNRTMVDPIYFPYRAFMEWSRERLAAAGEGSPFHPLLTVANLRIDTIQSENFSWIDPINFHVSESKVVPAKALSNVGLYDYAEFSYKESSNCRAGALRLQVNDDTSIIFIMARNVSDDQCSSSKNLLKVLDDQNLEKMNFVSQRMFVTIPVLRVSTIAMPERKLTQFGLLSPKEEKVQTSRMFADHYESASLIFNPEVPQGAPIPMIHPDTPRFQADRPFVVLVLQKSNPVPALVGFVQNPNADFECCSAPDPIQIAISYLNKGKVKGQQGRSRRGQPRSYRRRQ